MKRTLLGLSAVVFSCLLMAAAKPPEREVEGNRLISKSAPTITIQVPRSAVYLGAERWDLYDVADCELHLFVEAFPDKTVKAMYWIQFEAYLPTNEHTAEDLAPSGYTRRSSLMARSRARSGRPSNKDWSNAR